MSQPILSIRNLVKTYPNGVQALKGVSFDVKKGEFLVIIGLSGSGKSTLLRCVNRLHDPTSGEILFEGKDIAKVQGEEVRSLRKHIGMIFQHFNLIPRHSVLSNVLMGRLGFMSSLKSIFGLFSDEDKTKALEYLRLVGIAEKAKIRADQLSGGQQQRVAIARAIITDPTILVADEPTGDLDRVSADDILGLLERLNVELGKTIIMVTHDPHAAQRAHHIRHLEKGLLTD